MGTIKTSGIIISESNLGDYDKMLTMLTPGLGKISCVAKGARRPRSALLAGTQLFCFGEYMMYKGTNTYNINSCDTIEVFYNLRTDLDKLNYAVEITKIIRDVTDENENCYKILQMLLNTLYTLSETDKNIDLVISTFKLKLLCFLGFTPRINECTNCKQKEELKYYFTEFEPYEGKCKFQGCDHVHEPNCAVKAALEEGKIHHIRYENYLEMYNELKEKRRY